MGFGKKTDLDSGRTLDLDKTYENIIKPAVDSAGLRPIRADEVWHSSVIDLVMYEMLYRADLVVADISTANPNAIYELGVRHALRPRATIVMKESEGKYFFDLNHESTFNYKHLGEDIGATEAARAKRDLEVLIKSVMENGKTDSPVYTFLPKLSRPIISDENFENIVEAVESKQEHISELMNMGEACIADSRFADAFDVFSRIHEIRPNEPYIIQRLALSRYKGKNPSELTALLEAHAILDKLAPEDSNDPETLGLSGAIHKNIWLLTQDVPQLDRAVAAYARGFNVRRDYYNGENLALCYDMRAAVECDDDKKVFFKISAERTRESIISIIDLILSESDSRERSDVRWLYATMSNTAYALGLTERADEYERAFISEKPAQWEHETFARTREQLNQLGLPKS
jgi:tetratricopeptide (TPR) repeat protein